MSSTAAGALTWSQYLDSLDEAISRIEHEIAWQPGSIDSLGDPADDEMPEGDLPRNCLHRARELNDRLLVLTSLIETQMEALSNHRVALTHETGPVFFDSKF